VTTFDSIAAFVDLPRLGGLVLSPDGRRLVVTRQEPDPDRSRYVSSLWEIPLDGGAPVRLTRSDKGEGSPAFGPDGSLLFTSTRPDPDKIARDDEASLWSLPPAGEAQVIARRVGGVGGPVVATAGGTVLMTGSRLVHSTDEDDAGRRDERKDRKISAILQTGMPIRYWDHELGVESTRLLALRAGSDELVDLAPDAGPELEQADYSISADGARAAVSWRVRGPRGHRLDEVRIIDTATGERTALGGRPGHDLAGPVISPDGRLVAVAQERLATYDVPIGVALTILPVSGGDEVEIDLGDVFPGEWVWSADSRTVFVAGDRHGRGAVLAVDAATGAVTRRLVDDAAYSSLCPSPDGRTLYALRSAMDSAAAPVRLRTDDAGQVPEFLPNPAPTPALPGTVTELVTDVDGVDVHSWLFLPPASDAPAPVMTWIHGGPIASYNAWSWRWNPWLAVARGWAVILPDPALSTGYGQACIDRAWPYLADVVWHEIEGVLDAVLERPDVDASRVALLGGSFGGFMTNWIAGHTDRFGAIVTHAGLWALDQQHATTDAADYKTGVFGTLAEHPDWYARYSPHTTVHEIVTPMLVIHGNRDYRVPVSEALRLWWDLVSRWAGDPDTMPHRLLQFTTENHWVLTPGNSEIWYDVVLGFCAEHVLGQKWTPTPLL
jgi:dipeptidyl aminopeptidase/acylaminoacyl peptidase